MLLQIFNVTQAGNYSIEVAGARGGVDSPSGRYPTNEGLGANVSVNVNLSNGDTVYMVVGGMGESTNPQGPGGGGGSFVFATSYGLQLPIIAAGMCLLHHHPHLPDFNPMICLSRHQHSEVSSGSLGGGGGQSSSAGGNSVSITMNATSSTPGMGGTADPLLGRGNGSNGVAGAGGEIRHHVMESHATLNKPPLLRVIKLCCMVGDGGGVVGGGGGGGSAAPYNATFMGGQGLGGVRSPLYIDIGTIGLDTLVFALSCARWLLLLQ